MKRTTKRFHLAHPARRILTLVWLVIGVPTSITFPCSHLAGAPLTLLASSSVRETSINYTQKYFISQRTNLHRPYSNRTSKDRGWCTLCRLLSPLRYYKSVVLDTIDLIRIKYKLKVCEFPSLMHPSCTCSKHGRQAVMEEVSGFKIHSSIYWGVRFQLIHQAINF